MDKYDYVLIDSRPDMGVVVTSVFQASDYALVPTTITDNALDVGSKLFLAYFPYLLRDDNSETIFPRTRVADIRCLAAGNEVDDVAGTQIFQNHVYLLTV